MNATRDLDDAGSLVKACRTLAGLEDTPLSKLNTSQKRLEDKLGKDGFRESLLTVNSRTSEGGQEEDLRIMGHTLLARADAMLITLDHLCNVAAGVQCREECAIEYSSAYLNRVYNEAKVAGVDVPVDVLVLSVSRHCQSLVADGNFQSAVEAFDPESEGHLGMSTLKSQTTVVTDAQEKTAVIIMENMLQADIAYLTLKGPLKELAERAKDAALAAAIRHVSIITEPADHSETTVYESISCLLGEGESSVPGSVQFLFLSGAGRTLIKHARNVCHQIKADAGSPSPLVGNFVFISVCLFWFLIFILVVPAVYTNKTWKYDPPRATPVDFALLLYR